MRYANVNLQNNDGETALFFAVDGCNIKSLSNIIKYYRMKMFRFFVSGQVEIFKELLKVDEINVNIQNNENDTVLFRAVDNCNCTQAQITSIK